ncbi:uncharacterized protein A1O9_03636 [Exophiala aquamarina CBS 119918]|uniref:ABM domain-containing protein n=1 Tax=Exophiala aquamarina CBS 119918 TaxID=1182545 RepID=A0A072PHP0_9EURO|nr:uncharacterized protein A1O9_03636 [Exophiala aquamarina CBS 119918]KEF58793.1 hypothetical protein A1O9_03636 [Exophiala aquamarina CBS 119918]
MFEVIFEVCPRTENWELYLSAAKRLRPLLESQRGFIENIRYKSLTRPGWVLSLSDWENEKALIRWRTEMKHHDAQQAGRQKILQDYHLRVGEAVFDTAVSAAAGDQQPTQERFDETEVGEAKMVTLINTTLTHTDAQGRKVTAPADEMVDAIRLQVKNCRGLVAWDVFEAILTPGEVLVLYSWINRTAADHFLHHASAEKRKRQVRVIRDYGMVDRREAPQYYPEAPAS